MTTHATAQGKRAGSVTVWLAVSMTAIIGVVALGMDGGRMMEERRRAQAVADAAALGAAKAANDLAGSGSPSASAVTAAAVKVAADNGYPSAVVSARVGPTSGQFTGRVDCVEVIILTTIPATFGRVLTGSDPSVRARAVARFQPTRPGVATLDPSASGSVQVSGNGVLKIKNGSVVVNSKDPNAYQVTGNGDSEAVSHQVAGGYNKTPNATIVGPVSTGVTPTADALAGMPAPSLLGSLLQSANVLNLNTNTTLQPGLYIGGIQVNGSANVTMAPGLYYIQGGGLQVQAAASLTGNGVTIYNTGGGNVQFGNTTLTPPPSGPYANVVFFQDRTVPLKLSMGDPDQLKLGGIFYGPSVTMQLNGKATITGTGQGGIVSKSLTVSGQSQVNLNIGGGTPGAPIRLVE